MPQSLSVVYIHLVFSTKERRPFLRDPKLRANVHGYLGEISKRLNCPPILVGGVEDHVHLLARFGRTITQAEYVADAEYGHVLALVLDNGLTLFPMRDDEGNGPGALHYQGPSSGVLPTMR